MEEEDKDGTLKAGEKLSTLHPPTAKPRPVPRLRNQPKRATTTQNGKPDKIPPKPVILPKPRRPPPNAPYAKPVSPDKGILTNNNEVPIDRRPLVKPHSVTETSNSILSSSNLPPSRESINNVETSRTENGPADVNSADDDEHYEPLRPRTESVSSRSDDDYEHVSTIDKSKDSQAMVPRSVKRTFEVRMKSEFNHILNLKHHLSFTCILRV